MSPPARRERRRPSTPPRRSNDPARWFPALAAAGVLGAVLLAATFDNGGTPDSAADQVGGGNLPLTGDNISLTLPATTQAGVVVGSSVPTPQKSTIAEPVTIGSTGPDVTKVQERLAELGFAPGPVDGVFGDVTQQAVWAYKKLVLKIPRDELDASDNATMVTPEMWLTMQDPIVIQPRRPEGVGRTHTEIYLPEQVLVVFTDDKPTMIAHIASGDDKEWCQVVSYNTDEQGRPLEEPVERDECGRSHTPGGVFKFNRRYDGVRQSPLGGLYNPVYFNYGIAVHGAQNVPLHPASHGCVRIHMALAETFPDLVENGDHVYVWGQDGREPEQYSKQETIPPFNWRNPNSTTTTSSTTTTTTTTTTIPAPTSTHPATHPTTTSAPQATTSVPHVDTTPPVSTLAPTTTIAPLTEPAPVRDQTG